MTTRRKEKGEQHKVLILWSCNDGASTVSIKIIDWDCAHCLAEGAFCPRIAEALVEHKPTRSATFGFGHDWKYFNVLNSDIVAGDERWTDLASYDKLLVDKAFYALFSVSSL